MKEIKKGRKKGRKKKGREEGRKKERKKSVLTFPRAFFALVTEEIVSSSYYNAKVYLMSRFKLIVTLTTISKFFRQNRNARVMIDVAEMKLFYLRLM